MYKYTNQSKGAQVTKSAKRTLKVINYLKQKGKTDNKYAALASDLGISRRTFFRALAEIKSKGLIEVQGMRIIVWKGAQ